MDAELAVSRFVVTGHAETRPRATNETPEGRASNRRVDISIVRGIELDIDRNISIEGALTGARSTRDEQP